MLFRSSLYLPASNQRAIEKSRSIDTDVIVFDLEDAVADKSKQLARDQLTRAFGEGGFGYSRTALRINTIGSDHYKDDLLVVGSCKPDIVLLPKVSEVAQVQQLSNDFGERFSSAEPALWFMIETAAGLVSLGSLIESAQAGNCKLEALVVGTNDIVKETGVSAAENRQYLFPLLMQIVLQAKHQNIAVLDGVWNRFSDEEGFRAETDQSVKMGFDGKTLIHPNQVDYANMAFSPGEDEIAMAKRVVAEFNLPGNDSLNVISIDGEMVERLHLEQSVELLKRLQSMQRS